MAAKTFIEHWENELDRLDYEKVAKEHLPFLRAVSRRAWIAARLAEVGRTVPTKRPMQQRKGTPVSG
jgi:hypothetical protein